MRDELLVLTDRLVAALHEWMNQLAQNRNVVSVGQAEAYCLAEELGRSLTRTEGAADASHSPMTLTPDGAAKLAEVMNPHSQIGKPDTAPRPARQRYLLGPPWVLP